MTAQFRLGLLRLTDSAPALLAQAAGLFAEEGVAVDISIEPSWANIADKLSFGALDAAVILPPLAIAIAAGLRGARRRLVLPMSLSSGGNTVTLAAPLVRRIGLAGSALDRARRLKAALAEITPPRLAVVHGFSTHNLLLRYWLAAGGIDPDRDVEILTLPPEATADALAAGAIDGFCAGAPWGAVAEASGAGARLVGTNEIWGAHPEKALVVDAARAEAEPAAGRALLRALMRAARRMGWRCPRRPCGPFWRGRIVPPSRRTRRVFPSCPMPPGSRARCDAGAGWRARRRRSTDLTSSPRLRALSVCPFRMRRPRRKGRIRRPGASMRRRPTWICGPMPSATAMVSM
jgi:ABC-type nitrate/sulfonate/bicarbonate transport system substrate-binding protein